MARSKQNEDVYQGWELTEDERAVYRRRTQASNKAKAAAMRGDGPVPVHELYTPKLRPLELMPDLGRNGLSALSLFSGGGGLDLAFDRSGFTHVASYEWMQPAANTLVKARPDWQIFGGEESGDVRGVDWTHYENQIDVLHGGPPCQPFSTAGRQKGEADPRDMVPEFVRAVTEAKPRAFMMENVPALTQKKFAGYVNQQILEPLSGAYRIETFFLQAAAFGVPQSRKRVFFVGIEKDSAANFVKPEGTHNFQGLRPKQASQASLFAQIRSELPVTMGVRESLGLPDIGIDRLAPTLRSTLTGPRHTTSILSSTAAQRVWAEILVWPNGVAPDRESARRFVAKDDHFRLSVPDCALIQGFPDDWPFEGATYMALGQIGNAVPPPMGYAVAKAIRSAIQK